MGGVGLVGIEAAGGGVGGILAGWLAGGVGAAGFSQVGFIFGAAGGVWFGTLKGVGCGWGIPGADGDWVGAPLGLAVTGVGVLFLGVGRGGVETAVGDIGWLAGCAGGVWLVGGAGGVGGAGFNQVGFIFGGGGVGDGAGGVWVCA